MPSKIAVVILAAGASKRMGEPKQLLKWGDSTLITHTIQTALKLKVDTVYVVLGANFKLIENSIAHFPITILNNENWEQGLGESIAFTSKHLQNETYKPEGILFVLADQPFITVSYLKSIISSFSKGEKQIIASSYQNRKFGVPALFDSYYINDLSDLKGDFGAKNFLQKSESFIKALKPPVKNVDLDFKEDYEKFYKEHFK
ncbi:MAG: nucleotidyltransferase family protein [Flavobacteriaceae bacterium]